MSAKNRLPQFLPHELQKLRGAKSVPKVLADIKKLWGVSIHSRTYYRWENGEIAPSGAHLMVLCSYFGVDMRQLFKPNGPIRRRGR